MISSKSNRNKTLPATGLIRAVRVQNLSIVVLAQYFTAIFLNESDIVWQEVISNPDLLFISISTVLIAGAGYLINDYYDVKIDYVNHPETVVIGSDVSRRLALFLHSGFSAIGVLLGAVVSIFIGLINILSAFFLWLYSNHLKRLPFIGNFLIGVLTSTSILLVAFVYPQSINGILVYAFFAGFFSMVREIIKDMEDQKGDAQFGCMTLPVIWGLRKTKVFLYILVGMFLMSFVYLSFLNFNSIWLPFSMMMTFLTILLVYKIYSADTKKNFNWLSNYCKLILVLGLGSMFFV